MMMHDTLKLWELAARELDEGDTRWAAVHLEECPECREDLALVRSLRQLAAQARAAIPAFQWEGVDASIGSLLERHAARSAGLGARPWRWLLLPAAAAAGAVLALGARAALPSRAEAATAAAAAAPATAPLPPEPPRPSTPGVLSAKDAQRLQDGLRLSEGSALAAGDSVRTGHGGHALIGLRDESVLRLGPDSQLKLSRSSSEDTAVALERGRVAARATHCIEVNSGGFRARGVASAFSVAATRNGVEVAVSQGRVHVERPNALPMLVSAGKRVTFSPRRAATAATSLSPENRAELDRLVAAPRRQLASAQPLTLSDGEWLGAPSSPATGVAVAVALPTQPLVPAPAPTPTMPPSDALAPLVPSDEYVSFPQTQAAPKPTARMAAPAQAQPASRVAPWQPAPAAPAPEAVAAYPDPVGSAQPASPPMIAPAPAVAEPAPQSVPAPPEHEAMRAALAAKGDVALRPGMLLAEPQPPPREVLAEQASMAAAQATEFSGYPQAAPPAAVAPVVPSVPASPPVTPAPMPLADLSQAARPAAGQIAPDESGDDAEDLYLLRAERALKRGGCQRFLTGLEEIASDLPANERSERARIVRARCFEQMGKTAQAQSEYAQYLRESPRGDFALEAERHAAVAAPQARPESRLSDL
ncbi:MAG: FecR domain-containing protein [Deltaproteobacteria bacterium]|nr:FecR domain-containing protein [Deltaproteobacteria bacterium]